MQRSSYYISSCNITLELVVEGSTAFHAALLGEPFWYEFVPNFQLTTKAPPIDTTWYINEATELNYTIKTRTIASHLTTIKRVVIIIEAVFERLRQEQSLYTMHGAAIVNEGQAISLIGNLSGIGKTTLAAYAARHGWLWIADEKFTISKGRIIGSTSGILANDKTRASASGILPSSPTANYPLAAICQPIVTTETEVTRHTLSSSQALWLFYDEMSRDIRQVDGIVDTLLPPLPSLDTCRITAQRLKAAEALIKTVPAVYLRGPKELLLPELAAMLR